MKFEFNFDWVWVLNKVRILFLVAVFCLLYIYVDAVWAFAWVIYFILNDLVEIVVDIQKMKEDRMNLWKSVSTKREGF